MSAIHHIMAHKGCPWDKRLEYIRFWDYNNFFTVPHPIVRAGTPEELSVVLSFDSSPSGDKKFFGAAYNYGVQAYYGRWRPTAFLNGDTSIPNYISSTKLKIRFTLSWPNGGLFTDPDTNEVLYSNYPPPDSYDSDCSGRWAPFQEGMIGDGVQHGPWESQRYTFLGFGVLCKECYWNDLNDKPPPVMSCDFFPHKFHDFYRKVNGKVVAHLVPCIVDGKVGVCDEISGEFYTSRDLSCQPEAGPIIKNNGGYNP